MNASTPNVRFVEVEASTAGLRQLAESNPLWERNALRRAAVLDYAQVFRDAEANDECAVSLRDHSIQVWSTLAVNLIHAYDPEKVIVGGGIMASAEIILPRWAPTRYVRAVRRPGASAPR